MKTTQIALPWLILGGCVLAALGGVVGFQVASSSDSPEGVEAAPEPTAPDPAPEVAVVEPAPTELPPLTEADIEAMLADASPEESTPAPPPGFDPEDMEARRQRWESMTVEQRQMMRKSMFAALAKVDGLEEIGDAIREGKVDPRQFRLDPQSIADRMEFFAETMDQESMEAEVTRTLQEVVDQARDQLKGGN